MKMGKAAAWILSFLLFLGPVAGCSNSSDTAAGKPEPVELEFWTINLKKNFSDYIEGSIKAYEKDHPGVKIKWVDVPGADVTKKLLTALSSNNVPDVVNETTLGLSVLQGYNALEPVSDLVGKEKLDLYIDGLVKSVTNRDGKVMAIPWYHAGPPIGLINTELYKKAGLDPDKPSKTWDELFSNGKQIHQKLPNVYGSNDLPVFEAFITEGLPILSNDRKKAVFNSPQHVAFVEKFVQAYKDGAIAPGALVKDDRQLQQTIDNQLTAHVGLAGSFQLNNIEKNAPNVLPKLKVVPPVTKTGKVAIKDFQLFVIPKKSKHPKEAADFALYMTSPQKQLEFCKLVPIFPSTKDTLKDPFFTDFEVKTVKDQARKVMVEYAPNLTLAYMGIPNEDELRQYYLEQIRAAMLGQKSVKDALDAAVKHWNEALAKQ
jgi:putative chitobiose transport system substrate-binding protein